ncbi:MAG TPA: HD domain-containing phosphohydrolase [Solirubrobacter sp.]|nr:HD domain-containing phosphohydrolase [Solirubrobacter sp.]
MAPRRVAFAALFAALAAHVVFTFGVVPVPSTVIDVLYLGIEGGAVALTAARAIAVRRNRTAWWLIAIGIACWTLGDVTWTLWFDAMEHAPLPNVGDVFYLGMYAFLYVALVVLLRDRVRPCPSWLAIDGLLAGLTLAAVAAGPIFVPVQEATQGGAAVVGTTLAYIVGDLLLLVLVLVSFAVTAWRPGASWWLLGLGIVVCALADTFFVFQESTGAYDAGTWLDNLWPAALVAIALAAWQRTARPSRPHVGWSMGAVPLVASVVAIAVLIDAGLTGGGRLTVLLAGAALFAGIARAALMLTENFTLLRSARHEALTDKLTDLPNRRALLHDLELACASARPHTLVFFDLDGFKDYNDAFGHPAGDALLGRLGPALGRVGATAYRLGGDEFCLLIDRALDQRDPLVERAVDALSAEGDGFSIGASHGLVVIPDDAADATEALRVADERMYARKRRRRGGSRSQARDLLVKVMVEREPGLGTHNSEVALLAGAVGRRLGLDAESLDVLLRAAELHDVGKVAIPDSILNKPGPLDDSEWPIMRQHTVAGERILGVAESMRPVARIVRASHERWDGTGYPDGLGGEQIPLAARIVCACDAYDAMRSVRAYKDAMRHEEAVAELRRCSGTQFDPRVVEVLAEVSANLDTLVSG